MLKRVAIYNSENNTKTRSVIMNLIDIFCSKGIKVQLFERSGEIPICPGQGMIEKFSDMATLSGTPELVISVGGDGTFLETMLGVKNLGIPVAGINTGRLGFLANISEDELSQSLSLILEDHYEVVERSLLLLKEPGDLFEKGTQVALNEITIQKADLSMITITVYVDDVYLNTYWADGLIISTATGSTAYNLSAGGPILCPEDESIIISPISPHNLTIRPIIIPGNSSLRLIIEGRASHYLATCDYRSTRVPFGREVLITGASWKLKTVMLRGMDFYSTLRNKLMWGADKRN